VSAGDANAEYHLVERRCALRAELHPAAHGDGGCDRRTVRAWTAHGDAAQGRGGQAAARFYPATGASRSAPASRFVRTMRE
jgi:hypothetical protein